MADITSDRFHQISWVIGHVMMTFQLHGRATGHVTQQAAPREREKPRGSRQVREENMGSTENASDERHLVALNSEFGEA